ncbi:hypothetical protein QAD02_015734 [Eretmocerus hayati]|uniref:Uncharacterized protein n=1 Tax=Eretmocerus hayati TaxID=131215 RepID=A0ACC2PBY6_9HYME|nr:hypothetical protein QAD02_015734 [Eretmocerus hayati]
MIETENDEQTSGIVENKKKFKCDYQDCNLEFAKASALTYHMNVHLNLRPFKCAYVNCDKAYCSPSHLQRHNITHDVGIGIDPDKHMCKECSATFTNSSNLKRHMKRKHDESNKKNFCVQCNKQFKKQHLYEEHVEFFHHLMGDRLKSFECEQCGKVLNNLRSFKRHKRNHLKKFFTCPEEGCSAVFLTKPLLQQHKQSTHIYEFYCADCSLCFTSKCDLRRHVYSHLESEKSYACPYDDCNRVYTRKSNLNMHVKSHHTKEITFQCSVCQLYLSSKQKLKNHTDIFHKFEVGIG